MVVLRRVRTVLTAALFVSSVVTGERSVYAARGDERISGYISAILERELSLPRGSFDVQAQDGFVTLRLTGKIASERGKVEEALRNVDGIRALNIVEADTGSFPNQDRSLMRSFVVNVLGITGDVVYFPTGDVFLPLLADPKQPQFYTSIRGYRTPNENATVGAASFGETFGLVRRLGRRGGDGFQTSVYGGLFAQFAMDRASQDLINADYTVGIPLTYRRGATSARARLYHQSSHLGDEFLLRFSGQRVNFSYESLELLLSSEYGPFRAYGGGERLFDLDPSDFENDVLHYGLEFRSPYRWFDWIRPVVAADLKHFEENDWNGSVSVVGGVEFGDAHPGRRHIRILAEGYAGHAPHGQFYDEYIKFFGAGIYLGF